MARDLTPDEIETLLGAYALGAVDDEERAAVEALVARDPEVAEELEQLRDGALWLAVSGAPRSGDVWERIRAATAPEPTPLRLSQAGGRPPARRIRTFAVAAAVVVGLVVGGAVVASLDDDGNRTDLAAAVADAQFSRDAVRVRLDSPQGDALVQAVLLPDGTGYLVGGDLPRLPRGRTYQLWAVNDLTTVSLGVLGHRLKPAAFTYAGSPALLAITEEVAGGVAQSDQAPVVAGKVPSA